MFDINCDVFETHSSFIWRYISQFWDWLGVLRPTWYVLRFEINMRSVWDDLRHIWFKFRDASHNLGIGQKPRPGVLLLIWRYALSSICGSLPPQLSCVRFRGQYSNVSQDGPNQDQVFFCLAGWLASWLIWRYAVLVCLYPPLSWVVLRIGRDVEKWNSTRETVLKSRDEIIILHTRHLHEDQLCEREISTSPGKFPNGGVRPENSLNEGNLDCRRGIPAIPLSPSKPG